jgi:hypothetical protein
MAVMAWCEVSSQAMWQRPHWMQVLVDDRLADVVQVQVLPVGDRGHGLATEVVMA